eukprot:CAMPEP_0203635558 /NCGR_PEP_ID=MMETSP0088-20131115/2319_1 /ASSEMBLY_ACC=CAM_ASM_001087 /TAXON_ID=426623 /ORGANISM="Chaetoceros affinis, Strain CCMP159" /LENGTH=409 /DNA_ID=CAMNT_0050489475 /DNA_START=29 /DNA_END=1255 /DNA_ORIENTATION=-
MSCCTGVESQVSKPTVLIIGGGFGGLGCAVQLVKNGGAKDKNVILVEKNEYFSIGGMWQFVWNSRLQMEDVKWPLKKANLPGIDVRTKTAVSKWIPNENKVILSNKKEIKYQHIVVSCGVVADPKDVPGIENTVNICSESHVERQKKEMKELVEKAKTEKVTFCLAISVNPYKCPPAPYELTFLVDEYLRNAGVRDNARVILTAPVDWTMPPNTKPVILEAFKEQDIEFMPNKALEKVENNKLFFKDGSDPLECTTLWSIWPIRAPDFVQEAGLDINAKGTVNVENKVTNTIPNVPGAHIIGDACRVPFGQAGLPKAGEFAWKMGVSVADAISGKTNPADRKGNCAAEAGFGKGFILTPNFSDVCNDPENGKPKVGIEKTEKGTALKVDWCNEYLKEIFGENVLSKDFF